MTNKRHGRIGTQELCSTAFDGVIEYTDNKISEVNTSIRSIEKELGAKEKAGAAAAALETANSYTDGKVNTLSESIKKLDQELDTKELKGSADKALEDAKSYTNTKINIVNTDISDLENLVATKESKGSAAQALEDAKSYTNTKVATINESIESLEDEVATKETAGAAEKALREYKTYVNNQIEEVNQNIAGVGDSSAAKDHTHIISQVSNLQNALDNKDDYGSAAQALIDAKKYTDEEISDAIAKVNSSMSDLQNVVDTKATTDHGHSITEVVNLQNTLDNKDPIGAADKALKDANAYTDKKISDLIGTASENMDTLGEVQTAIANGAEALEALELIASGKANKEHIHELEDINGLQIALDNKDTKGSADQALLDANRYTDTKIGSAVDTINTNISTIENKINTKSDSDHTHNYAGSSTVGGAANSANKLNTDAGNENTPVYFKDGVPVPVTAISVNTQGNSETASHLKTARKITLSGDANGEVSFDGSKDVTIEVEVTDDSHNHTTANITGLGTALASKANTNHTHTVVDITDLQSKLDEKLNTSDITIASDASVQALFG